MTIDESQKSTPDRFPYIGAALVLILILIAVVILLPALQSNHGKTPLPVQCQSHLRQIGGAIALYANDHHGQFPDSLPNLLSYLMADGDWDDTSIFVCPVSTDTPATGPTTKAVIENMEQGGHLSYIYVGSGLTIQTATEKTVVAFEPLANHLDGINVLFGDGRVEFVNQPEANEILAKWKTVKLPVAAPSGGP